MRLVGRVTSAPLCLSGSVLLDSQTNASQVCRALSFPGNFIFCHPAFLSLSCLQVDDPGAALKELETHLGFPLQGFVPYTRAVRPSMEIPRENLQKYLENVLSDEAKGIAVLFALQPESLHILEPLALSIV